MNTPRTDRVSGLRNFVDIVGVTGSIPVAPTNNFNDLHQICEGVTGSNEPAALSGAFSGTAAQGVAAITEKQNETGTSVFDLYQKVEI